MVVFAVDRRRERFVAFPDLFKWRDGIKMLHCRQECLLIFTQTLFPHAISRLGSLRFVLSGKMFTRALILDSLSEILSGVRGK